LIVTNDLEDFPAEILPPFSMEAASPDAFLQRLLLESPDDVYEASETHRLSLKNPPKASDNTCTPSNCKD